MIAGTIAMLTEAADDPLEDYHDSGQRAIDVEASHTYLDGHRIQSGMVAGPVPEQTEQVTLDGSSIEVEQRDTRRLAASEFVADVDGAGWILAERTQPTDEEHRPPWPFTIFSTRLGYEIEPMGFDPTAFVERVATGLKPARVL